MFELLNAQASHRLLCELTPIWKSKHVILVLGDSDAAGPQKKKTKEPIDEEMGVGYNDSAGEITEEDIQELKNG